MSWGPLAPQPISSLAAKRLSPGAAKGQEIVKRFFLNVPPKKYSEWMLRCAMMFVFMHIHCDYHQSFTAYIMIIYVHLFLWPIYVREVLFRWSARRKTTSPSVWASCAACKLLKDLDLAFMTTRKHWGKSEGAKSIGTSGETLFLKYTSTLEIVWLVFFHGSFALLHSSLFETPKSDLYTIIFAGCPQHPAKNNDRLNVLHSFPLIWRKLLHTSAAVHKETPYGLYSSLLQTLFRFMTSFL